MKPKRKRKVIANLSSALLLQIVALVCGFILPRLILVSYGSAYNGIVNSINQFLSCVTLLRAGVGGVTRAALYGPLNEKNTRRVTAIVRATEIFMRKIAGIFSVFLLGFAVIYPFLVIEEFPWLFSFTLILTIGFSTVIQYFFGITYSFLLQADQKLYIYNFLQIVTYILNTIVTVVLIRYGFEIRVVKLASSLVFCITPLVMYSYVHKTYVFPDDVEPDHSCISQRWDAFAHQVSAFVHNNTDLMVLTIFSTLYQISVYSVYYLVVNGIRKLIDTCSGAIEALFGNMIANQEKDLLKTRVRTYEWSLHMISGVLFGATLFLIVPFVAVYTRTVVDTDYANPFFGCLICMAEFMACVRLPYQNLTEAAGHFKQTRRDAITEAALNILISIALVRVWGICGVAVGTLVAMTYRTIKYAAYASRVFIQDSLSVFIKRLLISLISIAVYEGIAFVNWYEKALEFSKDYFHWALLAILVTTTVFCYLLIINTCFYPHMTKTLFKNFVNRIRRKESK